MNYFSGEKQVSLSASLAEAEVMFAANDDVKAMAESGELKQLHDRCASLGEQSERDYITQKDRIENIVEAIQAQEDKIYNELINDLKITNI